MDRPPNEVKQEIAVNQRFELLARAVHEAVWDWDLVTDRLWTNLGRLLTLRLFFGGDQAGHPMVAGAHFPGG